MPFLEIKDLYKRFGDTEVLRGVNLGLEKGEALAVIGSSGGGKTTLLRCIAFLERADLGEILLDGTPVFCASSNTRDKKCEEAKAQKIGMVFQAFNLFPHFSVKKNLTLAARLQYNRSVGKPRLLSVFSSEARKAKRQAYHEIDERAEALLKRVGLEEKASAYPCELSGGQQQRVAIARALMLKPDVLCFDEPTSALDPELTQEVMRVIKDLKRDGHSMIVVTHEMEFAQLFADKVAFVADGVVEEFGTPAEVFASPQSPKTKAFLANIM